jgi:basic membrane protein A
MEREENMLKKNRDIGWQIVSFLIIAMLILVGCQPAAPPASSAVTATQLPKPAATAEPVKPLKIGFVFNGSVNDMGWAWQFDQARQAIEKKFGNRVVTVKMENVPFSEEASRTMEQLIADGASLIVDATGFGEFLNRVSKAHPEVKFITSQPAKVENEYEIYYHQGQVSYLIGIAAGLMTKTNKIGYISAFDAPWIRTEINAYHMGARSVNPKVTTHVVSINAWWDPTANRQAASALIDSQVDFLFTILNDPTTVTVAQERKVWGASSNGEQSSFGKDWYATGRTVDWSGKFIEQVEKIFAGTWKGNMGSVDLVKIGSGLDLNKWGPKVPQNVIDQVNAMRTKMLNGFNPFVGPITDKQGKLVIGQGEVLTDAMFAMGGFTWTLEGVEGIK